VSADRIRLTIAEAREHSERALRGIGYDAEEARIIADHAIDAALCGYEYSGWRNSSISPSTGGSSGRDMR
jgi:LDH2 family malate/lactate/ureidoglycolate dehydrogenase